MKRFNLEKFKLNYPKIKIKAILADALYGAKAFVGPASKIYGNVQVISQVRKNQKVKSGNKYISVEEYFVRNPGTSRALKIRGGDAGRSIRITLHGVGSWPPCWTIQPSQVSGARDGGMAPPIP